MRRLDKEKNEYPSIMATHYLDSQIIVMIQRYYVWVNKNLERISRATIPLIKAAPYRCLTLLNIVHKEPTALNGHYKAASVLGFAADFYPAAVGL